VEGKQGEIHGRDKIAARGGAAQSARGATGVAVASCPAEAQGHIQGGTVATDMRYGSGAQRLMSATCQPGLLTENPLWWLLAPETAIRSRQVVLLAGSKAARAALSHSWRRGRLCGWSSVILGRFGLQASTLIRRTPMGEHVPNAPNYVTDFTRLRADRAPRQPQGPRGVSIFKAVLLNVVLL
jgi:hypothetical protein